MNRLKKTLGCDKFNDDKVWRVYAEQHGFIKQSFPAEKGKPRMSVKRLAEESKPNEVYICHCAGHLVTITQNKYWDTWDSGDKCVYTAYKKVS